MIDPNSNDLILGSQLSRHSDLLPHLVRSERQGQAVRRSALKASCTL